MKILIQLLVIGSLIGMMTSCSNAPAGEKAATSAAKEVAKPAAMAKTLSVSEGSMVSWTGSKLAGDHTGTLNVSSGSLNVEGNRVTGGKFMIDMNSLLCTDLEAGKGKEKLEGHLKAPDFFDTAKFPTSTFEITSVGGGNVTGNLTMKGITKSVTFPAAIAVSPQGATVSTNNFTINRTDWGIEYGSATLADVVKDKAINDMIGIKINLKAS